MIQKVAEVFALKRQFGISGLVTREEMKDLDTYEEPKDGGKVIEVKPDMVQVEDKEIPAVDDTEIPEILQDKPETCEECDAIIEDYKGMVVADVIKYGQKRFGMNLCGSCIAKKLHEEKKKSEETTESSASEASEAGGK
jgi:hypothetical protein